MLILFRLHCRPRLRRLGKGSGRRRHGSASSPPRRGQHRRQVPRAVGRQGSGIEPINLLSAAQTLGSCNGQAKGVEPHLEGGDEPRMQKHRCHHVPEGVSHKVGHEDTHRIIAILAKLKLRKVGLSRCLQALILASSDEPLAVQEVPPHEALAHGHPSDLQGHLIKSKPRILPHKALQLGESHMEGHTKHRGRHSQSLPATT